MATTRRREILAAMRDRIQAALPDAEVLVGRFPRLGPDDKPVAVAILPGADDVDDEAPRLRRRWEIMLHVVRVAEEGDDAWLDFESEIFGVVMAAVEDRRIGAGRDRPPGSTLGGLCQGLTRGAVEAIERTEGTRAEGVTITYELAYPAGVGRT